MRRGIQTCMIILLIKLVSITELIISCIKYFCRNFLLYGTNYKVLAYMTWPDRSDVTTFSLLCVGFSNKSPHKVCTYEFLIGFFGQQSMLFPGSVGGAS